MLTPEQLLSVCPVIRSVARTFSRAGELDDLEQTALLYLWEHRDADVRNVRAWAVSLSRSVFLSMRRAKTTEHTKMAELAEDTRQKFARPDGMHDLEAGVYVRELSRVREVPSWGGKQRVWAQARLS